MDYKSKRKLASSRKRRKREHGDLEEEKRRMITEENNQSIIGELGEFVPRISSSCIFLLATRGLASCLRLLIFCCFRSLLASLRGCSRFRLICLVTVKYLHTDATQNSHFLPARLLRATLLFKKGNEIPLLSFPPGVRD